MRPIKLALKGINSFEDAQEIDFEKLSSLGLFGIFGATGSGKSTIIDAVTLALYGRLSRYDGSSYCPFINTNCDEAAVRFEFEILEDSVPVRIVAEREYKKKETEKSKKIIADEEKKKHGVRASFRRLYKIAGDETIVLSDKNENEMTKAVIGLIGLTYDDFLKTVILPQGKFSGFLMLENKERRDMLERIFQLEQYGESLAAKIKDALQKSNNELSVLSQTRLKYEEITPETVAAEKEAHAAIQTDLARLKQEEADTAAQFSRYQTLNGHNIDCVAFEKQRDALDAAAEEMNAARETAAAAKKAVFIQPVFYDYETAYRNFDDNARQLLRQRTLLSAAAQRKEAAKALYDAAADEKQKDYLPLLNQENNLLQAIALSKEIDALQAERQTLLLEYKAIDRTLAGLKKNAETLTADAQTVQTDLAAIDEKKRAIAIDAAEKQQIEDLYEKNKAHGALLKALAETRRKLEKITAEIAEGEKTLAETTRAKAELAQKTEENTALLAQLNETCPGGAEDLIRGNNEFSRGSEELAAMKKLRTELFDATAQKARLSAAFADARAEKERLTAEFAAKTERLKTLTAQIDAFKNQNIVSVIAAQLIDGENCPVCGATAHPRPAEKIADGILEALEGEKNELEIIVPTLSDALKKAELACSVSEKELETIKRAADGLAEKIGDYSFQAAEERIAALKSGIDLLGERIRAWQAAKESAETTAREIFGAENALAVKAASLGERLKQTIEIKTERTQSAEKIQTEADSLKKELVVGDIEEKYKIIRQNELLKEKLEREEKTARETQKRLENEHAANAAARGEKETAIAELLTAGKEKKKYIDEKQEKYQALCGENADAARALTETRQRLAALAENEETRRGEHAAAEDAFKKAEEIKTALESRNGVLKTLLSDAEQKKADALVEQGFADETAFRAALMPPGDVETLEIAIKTHDENCIRVAGNLARLAEQLAGADRAEIAAVFETLRGKSAALAQSLSEKQTAAGGAAARIDAMEKTLSALAELNKKADAEKHRNDLLNQLARLFSGNRFVEFVAKRQLRNITVEASRWLGEMSRGRYAVELDGASFVLRDDFNGGKRRPPMTLSGGEIFMVSLCLALALSSKVQLKNRTPLDFFFLDEGFGTLDHFVLDTVLKCLELLQAEGMKIGLISHVEELKNRIEKKLIVERPADGIGGTRVFMP